MQLTHKKNILVRDYETLELPLNWSAPNKRVVQKSLPDELASFHEFGQNTKILETKFADVRGSPHEAPTFVNEFWTARQRQAHSLHEVSYRACFKPQLPRFFIERLTQPGDVVYDPFMGRGTTPMEAALLGRVPFGNDINPLSIVMLRPRLAPPTLNEITARLYEIDFSDADECPDDLLAFYHPETLRAIGALKKYFRLRRGTPASGPARFDHNSHRIGSGIGAPLDPVDEWIEMISLNRLTGHSPGFFSVYTLPPNQAVSVKSQRKINERRGQTPPQRDIAAIVLKKSTQLLKDCTSESRGALARVSDDALLLVRPADATRKIPDASVALVVTSPPFLNVVQYADDNWLRCWFLDIDPKSVKLTVPSKLEAWRQAMTEVFRELHRVLKSGGHRSE